MTAVEWLNLEIERLTTRAGIHMSWTMMDNLIKQAKEMEKQQIIDAAIWMPDHFNSEFLPELGKQYYNDRYKHKIYDEHK